MKKRMTIMLASVGLLFAAIIGYQMFVASMMKQFLSGNALPPATVSTTTVQAEAWQPQLAAVGTLRAIEGVMISSEVAGIVESVAVKSGESVEKGALLLAFDASVEKAQLAALSASRRLAEINHERNKKQYKIHAVSRADLDASEAEVARLKAEEARQKAVVEKRMIRAPFAGRLGVITASPGQYINPAEAIVSLQQSDRLYVDFKLPQRNLADIKAGIGLKVSTESQSVAGTVSAIDSHIDSATRNVAVEGMIDNSSGTLQPGMFVQVAVNSGSTRSHLTLPQTAVSYNPYGSTVFIAREGEAGENGKATITAEQVFVTTGPRRGDQIAILKGINAGDVIVTSGQMKLKNGTPLIINNSVTPANEIAPKPQEQ